MAQPFSLSLEEIWIGLRFFSRLPFFLRHPVSHQESITTLQTRLYNRSEDFLKLIKKAVFESADSPYLSMFNWLGCEYSDFQDLVAKNGVEEALLALLQQGFYLTVDEFKGRIPLKRGNFSILIDPSKLQNPLASSYIMTQTGGSGGERTPITTDLACIRDQAMNLKVLQEIHQGGAWKYAFWGVPGSSAMRILLRFALAGYLPLQWYTQVDPRTMGLHPRYLWSTRMMRWSSLLCGAPLPTPRYVPVTDSLPIIRWIEGIVRKGEVPYLFTFPSSAVCLAQAVHEHGASISGTHIQLTGEPCTKTRLDIIRSTGAKVFTQYGSVETAGPLGFGCLFPYEPDHMHLLDDLQAFIQPGESIQIPNVPSQGIFISSLRKYAPLILLNVSLGDQAVFTRRNCGCPLQKQGWTKHVHTIRSFEKLTCGGMALLDKDIIPVLEEILPARFGGTLTDYQLLEEEGTTGNPSLKLLVHPRLGKLDSQALTDVFFSSIGKGSGVEHMTELLWRNLEILDIVREIPRSTDSGKIQHMHLEKRKAS